MVFKIASSELTGTLSATVVRLLSAKTSWLEASPEDFENQAV